MTSDELAELLRSISPFYYLPNFGNLGDLLIAEGTRHFFRAHGISYTELTADTVLPPSYHLVCAGGARYTKHWCREQDAALLLDKRVRQCVILPHSINGVAALMAGLTESAHVICRDTASLDYCRSRGTQAQLHLSDDMALYLNPAELRPADTVNPPADLNEEERNTLKRLRGHLAETMKKRVRQASAQIPFAGKEQCRVAFLLRRDSEKALPHVSPCSYDISAVWETSGREMRYNANMLIAFAEALRQADVVVTDRLHVAMMCYKSGVPVYMADNAYRKLSGVYQQSLSDCPDVHLLPDGVLTPELQQAWAQLNTPGRKLRHCLSLVPERIARRIRRIGKSIRRLF